MLCMYICFFFFFITMQPVIMYFIENRPYFKELAISSVGCSQQNVAVGEMN